MTSAFVDTTHIDDLKLAYTAAEEACELCNGAAQEGNRTASAAARALAKAAYYLSERFGPDERAELLDAMVPRCEVSGTTAESLEVALLLGTDAASTIDWLVNGPDADSDLYIARVALGRAMRELTLCIGVSRVAELLSGATA